jgi:hypothetical protein
MSQKPPSSSRGESDQEVSSADPSDTASDLTRSEESGESYDDSLEAILLQAGARPPESVAAQKFAGSKTLMGVGIEGMASFRAALSAGANKTATVDGPGAANAANSPKIPGAAGSDTTDRATANLLDNLEANLPGAKASEEKQVTSLLDEVAQALNVQASEYRDRARGRLPGMPAPGSGGSMAAKSAGADSGDGVEFEDPDEVQTSLTPGVISVVDETDDLGNDIDLVSVAEDKRSPADSAIVLAPVFSPASGRKPESRPTSVPPVPGLSLAVNASGPVGPPPGVSTRSATPATGSPPSMSTSARVRLPTPAPGLSIPALPSPVGRLTLPLGINSPVGSAGAAGNDLTATSPSTPISLEASRRLSSGRSAATSDSGRVSSRNRARITEPVAPLGNGSSLPAVLTAQVKLATVNLAGLIAVTFAGGLFVGMMVWRGQTRTEPVSTAHVATTTNAPAAVAVPAAPTPTTAPATANNTPPTPGVATAAALGSTEAIVTPMPSEHAATDDAANANKLAAHRPTAALRAPRVRRPTPAPVVADTAALFPKAAAKPQAPRAAVPASASGAAAKTVATNSPAKPAAKAKTKAAWHDPFAD